MTMVSAPVGSTIAYSIFFTLAAFPGADVIGVLGLSVLLNIPILIMFALMAASMPRVGGDYVWVSRILSPPLGLISNVAMIFGGLAGAAFFAKFFSVLALGPVFASLGILANNSTLSDWGTAFETNNLWILVASLAMVLLQTVVGQGAHGLPVVDQRDAVLRGQGADDGIERGGAGDRLGAVHAIGDGADDGENAVREGLHEDRLEVAGEIVGAGLVEVISAEHNQGHARLQRAIFLLQGGRVAGRGAAQAENIRPGPARVGGQALAVERVVGPAPTVIDCYRPIIADNRGQFGMRP